MDCVSPRLWIRKHRNELEINYLFTLTSTQHTSDCVDYVLELSVQKHLERRDNDLKSIAVLDTARNEA